MAARELPPQHKLVILSIHITAELNGTTRAINSLLTRVVPPKSQKICGPGMYFATKNRHHAIQPTELVANMRARHIYNDPTLALKEGTAREKRMDGNLFSSLSFHSFRA